MGAYTHVAPRIKTCMLEEGRTPVHQMPYAGRPPCASTATGFGKVRGFCYWPSLVCTVDAPKQLMRHMTPFATTVCVSHPTRPVFNRCSLGHWQGSMTWSKLRAVGACCCAGACEGAGEAGEGGHGALI